MNTGKVKIFGRIFIVMCLCCFVIFGCIACSGDSEPSASVLPSADESASASTGINNGDINNVTGDSYPKTASGWTFNTSGSGNNAAPNGTDNILNGVIDVSDAEYAKIKDTIGGIDNPGKVKSDNSNVLMIWNKNNTAAYYSATSFSAAADKYYKVTATVKTLIDSDSAAKGLGANLYIKSGAYSEFINVNTNGEWKTYTTYIQSNKSEARSFTAEFWLGYGDNSATGQQTHVKGYLFIDGINVDIIEQSEYDAVRVTENEDEVNVDNGVYSRSNTFKYDMQIPDAGFDYYSTTTYYPKLPVHYTTTSSEGSTGTSYLAKGIISVDNESWEKDKASYGESLVNPGKHDGALGNNVLMISNKQATAAGYKASRKIYLQSGTYYKLSVWVRTDNIEADKGGAGIYLSGASNQSVKSINTNGEWKQYAFFIEMGTTQTKEFTFEMWLGRSGDLLTGVAYFDDLKLETLADKTAWEEAYAAYDVNSGTQFSLVSNNEIGDVDTWKGYTSLGDAAAERIDSREVLLKDGRIFDKATDKDITEEINLSENDVKALANRNNNALMIYNKDLGAYKYSTSNINEDGEITSDVILIRKNKTYRLSVWIKTIEVDTSKGVNVYLTQLKDGKSSTLSSVTAVNTAEVTSNNGWQEVVFYIQGGTTKDETVSLSVELGSGTKINIESLLEGYAFIGNPYLERVSYDEYTDATSGTYIKKKSFISNTASLSNGNFDSIDYDSSSTHIDDNGNLTSPAAPSNWTVINENDDTVSGIVNKALIDKLRTDDGFMATFPYDADATELDGRPNALMIWNKDVTYGGYKLTKSMSANTYYKLTVDVYTDGIVGDNVGAAFILSNNGSSLVAARQPVEFKNINTSATWKTYTVFIETGMYSVTTSIQLYLGQDDAKAQGVVYYDNVSLFTIDEDAYNAAVESDTVGKVSYMTDDFELIGDDPSYPVTPTNWTGSTTDSSAPTGTDRTQGGIINYDNFDTDLVNTFDGLDITKFNTAGYEISGNDFLIIYNKPSTDDGYTGTGYSFKTSSSRSLSSGNYYKLSVWVKTYNVTGGKANVKLTLGDDEEYAFTGLDASNWTQYTFFISTKDYKTSLAAYVQLGLGVTDNYATGYVGFDDVLFTKITETEYAAATEGDTVKIVNLVSPEDTASASATASASSASSSASSNDGVQITAYMIALIASSGLLSIALIVVLIVFLVRKTSNGGGKGKSVNVKKASYDRTNKTAKSENKNNDANKFKD